MVVPLAHDGRYTAADNNTHFGEMAGNHLWSRITVHYTPKQDSSLNQAEIEIGLYQLAV